MRNLGLLSSTAWKLPNALGFAKISATAIDLDDNIVFAASENIDGAEVEIRLWRTNEDGELIRVGDVVLPAIENAATQIISFMVIPETRTLCLITHSGEIAILPLDSDIPNTPDRLEIVGTITPGHVLAATASPDVSLLAIVTCAASPTLILMDTSSFAVVSSSLLFTAAFGESTPVNVGWGSKATQFHGSLGKSAAQAETVAECTTSPDDDGTPRISWRGDAQLFAISAMQERKRVLRVYNRLAVLQSTAEDVAGLEHSLAWRPSGGLIASTQRFGKVPGKKEDSWALGKGRDGRHDVVFFERNGLRHGEFGLREGQRSGESSTADGNMVRCWGYEVRALAWNAESAILSVWIERDGGDVVQLWTTGNYHWYLKLEIPAPHDENARFTSVMWHAEDSVRLILSTHNAVLDTRYTMYTAASTLGPPNDTGLTAVVDGADILLTPFRTQNIPPPMASLKLSLANSLPSQSLSSASYPPPIYVAISSTSITSQGTFDLMAALFTDGSVAIWELKTTLDQTRGKREAVVSSVLWKGSVSETRKQPRQVCVVSHGENLLIVVLGNDAETKDVLSVQLVDDGGAITDRWEVHLPGRSGRILQDWGNESCIVWQADDGGIWEVPLIAKVVTPLLIARFPEFCGQASKISPLSPSHRPLFVGLSSSKFFITSPITSPENQVPTDSTPPALILSQTCTSYAIAASYLTWTTTAPVHETIFARLSTLFDTVSQILTIPKDFPGQLHDALKTVNDTAERRRIERGARIVVAVPSAMSLVFQMPRGNLETIMPRPLVMEKVRMDVLRGDYRAAFLACRKHRVDLNVIVEMDPVAFTTNIAAFVAHLDDVDYINLFLSGVGRSKLPRETTNTLCDGIRMELQRRDVKKFVNSILTAHIVKTPPDYGAGLSLLLKLRDTDSDLVEDAVKYIIFLVDVDRLFDTALGMYDFSLVLLVAQHSQKDPREYLPFLRSLRALEGPYQHFKIDDHLKRYSMALRSLRLSGPEQFEEAKLYVERHQLYVEALELWKGETQEYNAMLEVYGDYLYERREFRAAALAFVRASRSRKAMVAYEKALDWQELFELALQDGATDADLPAIAHRVADDLGSKQRHVEAARVLLDYADDVDEAVASLVRGSAWSEARRITALRKRNDLFASIILPGALEARSSISDEIFEIQDLMDKQVGRLDELAARKIAEPAAFYGMEDENLANIDVMTDVSNPGTMFTRYTVAPTASDRSRRTSRSKRKLVRKAGRKGTVEEEEYLLKSITKLVVRLKVIQAETRALLPHLVVLSDGHAVEACDLQKEVEHIENAMRTNIERIWTERDENLPTQDHSTGLVDAHSGPVRIAEVPRPSFSDVPWQISWIQTVPK
ncbi:IKI3-domain-containing protein [Ramaria rubella]|nr:IKI3-domain-containing protein [Ramaria rubella]